MESSAKVESELDSEPRGTVFNGEEPEGIGENVRSWHDL